MLAWFVSVFQGKCPRCRKGKMFPEGTLYNPSKFGKMKDRCSECNQSFEPEPGYYFGAMFISYGINTFYFIAVWASFAWLFEEIVTLHLLLALSVVILMLFPLTFRWSRALWISILVRYKGNYS